MAPIRNSVLQSVFQAGTNRLLLAALCAACGGNAEQRSEAPPLPSTPAAPAANQGTDPAPPPLAPAPVLEDTGGTPVTAAPPPASEAPAPAAPLLPAMEPIPAALPPSSIQIDGCTAVGGYDRVSVFQRDAQTGVCTNFVLLSPQDEASEYELTSLSLPEHWAVDQMAAFACTPDGAMEPGATTTYYTHATGSVTFGVFQGALPSRMKLDVLLSVPAEDVARPAGQNMLEQRVTSEDLPLRSGCGLRG